MVVIVGSIAQSSSHQARDVQATASSRGQSRSGVRDKEKLRVAQTVVRTDRVDDRVYVPASATIAKVLCHLRTWAIDRHEAQESRMNGHLAWTDLRRR